MKSNYKLDGLSMKYCGVQKGKSSGVKYVQVFLKM